jgi:propanol-preferring alcohol dehydrogenase
VGSSGGDVGDVAAVYRLFAEGKLAPTLTTIGFEEIAEGLERLKAGTIQGRLVATIDG